MLASIESTRQIDYYLQYVDIYGLGWDVEVEPQLEMPGFTGSTELRYATPAAGSARS
jgi:hypothetical protein